MSSAPSVSVSLVIAMYRVAKYLPEFLASLEEQDMRNVSLECIFVDDGSPENEAEIAAAWLARTGIRGQVARKANGGVSSARNAGIELATGDWVSFPDPDDMLSSTYLYEIAKFASGDVGATSDVIAARLVFYMEETGETKDTHPLTFKFDSRPQRLSLLGVPHVLQSSSSSSFVRRSTLVDAGIRFDERLRVGEDAILIAQVFALNDDPHLGVVPTAEYLYRKRSTQDSALDQTSRDPVARLDLLALGYVPLARSLHASGRLNEWFGHLVLYDLAWLFKLERPAQPLSAKMSGEQRERILTLSGELLTFLDPTWIHAAIHPATPTEIKVLWNVLRERANGSHVVGPVSPVRVTDFDHERRLLCLRYFTTRPEADESVRLGGKLTTPRHAKTRVLEYFDQTFLYERILWVPATGWLRVMVDDRLQPITYSESLPRYSLFRVDYLRHFEAERPDKAVRVDPVRQKRLTRPRFLGGKDLSRAWLFMDRIDIAQDNAEHLYRHVRRTRPGINAWFVLQRDTPDWERLRREGFQLVEFRSSLHEALLRDAEHVISSHADVEMTNPLSLSAYPDRVRPWKFTFLQHGVTKDNLSRWLNHKPITTFVTATRAEKDSIAGEMTPYVFTSRETALTGFPRHDALLAKARSHANKTDRPQLLIAPTWRDGLLAPKKPFEPRRPIQGFAETSYVTNWRKLLNSPQLRELAVQNDADVVFLPHPQMGPFLDHLDIPTWITRRDYSDGDVQSVLAASTMLITDYSSLAFDVAYIGMPTVYFQFDREGIFAGLHTYTQGYYDYQKDGFGPICTGEDEVVRQAAALLEARGDTGDWPAPYRDRIAQTFPFRDGNCSERVTRAILASHPRDAASMKRKPAFARVRRVLRPVKRAAKRLLTRG